jgi:iron(III) transport system substrate-binding protein
MTPSLRQTPLGALRSLVAAIAAIAGLTFAPPSIAQPADASALSRIEGPDREKRLIEGARREGEVSVYTSIVVDDMRALAAAFESKYGVKVKYWRSSSEKILQRAVTEARANRYEVDVIETNGPELEALHREEVLAAATSAHNADLVPAAIKAHRQWTGLRLNMFVQAYNTNLVKKADLPRNYRDLLDPKWKGKLAIEAEDVDWFAAVVKDLGENDGLKLFRDVVAANGIAVRKGHTLLAGLVASGEVPLALTLYHHNAERLKQKGAPIDSFAIQPVYARVNGIAIGRKAPHPHAAVLFFDFMLSPEGQKILQAGNYVPTNLKLNDPATRADLRFIDPTIVLDDSARWESRFNEIITRQSR